MSKFFVKSLVLLFLTIEVIYSQRESWGYVGDREIFIGVWNGDTIYYANSLACILDEGYSLNDVNDFINHYDAVFRFNYFDDAGWGSIDLPVYYDALEVIQEWQSAGIFSSVEPVRLVTESSSVNDPKYLDGTQWYFNNYGQNPPGGTIDADVDLPDAWEITRGSPDIIISVIDSGIPLDENTLELSHPDLNNTDRILLEYSAQFLQIPNFVRDGRGHGTHVTGIIAAETNNEEGIAGVAGDCKIIVMRVFDDQGFGTDDAILGALNHSFNYLELGLRIINMSLVASPSQILENFISYAQQNNVLIVCAAGTLLGSIHYPAAYSFFYDNVIAVSATDQNDLYANSYSPGGQHINVSAPGGFGPRYTCPNGDDIFSTMPNYTYTYQIECPSLQLNYDYLYGTSMSAPIVSGIAALILSIKPDLTASEVRNILQQTADDKGEPGFDVLYGYGRVNAYKALAETVRRLADQNKSTMSSATGINTGRRLAKDQNGHYHFVFTSGNNIFYKKTSDNGTNWSQTVHISTDGGENKFPSVTAHGNFVFITYQQYNGIENNQHKYTIKGKWKQLGTSEWSSITSTTPFVFFNNQTNPLPVILAANNVDNNYTSEQGSPEVMIAFRNSDGIYHNNIFYLIDSEQGGSQFNYEQQGPTHKIPGTSVLYKSPSIAINGANLILLTCDNGSDLFAFSTTGAGWFAVGSSIFDVTGYNYYENGSITVDQTNYFHLAWHGWGIPDDSRAVFHTKFLPTGSRPVINVFKHGSYNSFEPTSFGHLDGGNGGVNLYWYTNNDIKMVIHNGTSWNYSGTQFIPTIHPNAGFVNSVMRDNPDYYAYCWTTKGESPFTFHTAFGIPSAPRPSNPIPMIMTGDSIRTYRSAEYFNFELDVILSMQFGNFILIDASGSRIALGLEELRELENLQSLSDAISVMLSDTIPRWNTLSKVSFEYSAVVKNLYKIKDINSNNIGIRFRLRDRINGTSRFSSGLMHLPEDSTLQRISGTLEIPLGRLNQLYNISVDLVLSGVGENYANSNEGGSLINTVIFGEKNLEKQLFILQEQIEVHNYNLHQNYPNPFNPTTTIKYDLPNTSDVSLIIYDILGSKVKELVKNKQEAGRYEVQFNASNLASGIYIYQLIADKYISSKKILLLK